MAFAASALLCLISGILLVQMGLRCRIRHFSECLLVLCLSIGFGLGLFSVTCLFFLLAQNVRLIFVDAATFVILVAGFLLCRFCGVSFEIGDKAEVFTQPAWIRRLLAGALTIALGAALYSAAMRIRAYPHGDGWDAFSIWNLHARFLFLGGANWRDGFTSLLPWSHPDYPLLLPAAVAHFWTYLGRDATAVPAAIGFLFTFSTAGLLFSVLSILRGQTSAMLGTIALLATPSFIELGTSQYADIPLSFFFLAAIALLCLHGDRTKSNTAAGAGLLMLSGLAASFAAWTKNEGSLFLCAVVAARLCILVGRKDVVRSTARARAILPLLFVVIPALLLIVAFKHFIAPPGDLFSDPTTAIHKLLDPARYWAITKWYFKGFFRFGRWWLIPGPLLMIGFYLAARKDDREISPGIRTSILALILTLVGYFAVYLITPYDIYWHLRFSLTRLFLQLWPSAIFVFFLLVGFDRFSNRESTSGA